MIQPFIRLDSNVLFNLVSLEDKQKFQFDFNRGKSCLSFDLDT